MPRDSDRRAELQNFSLLKHAGRARLPVLLKRGRAATLDEWLLAAVRHVEGNYNVIFVLATHSHLCATTRNTLDLAAIPRCSAFRPARHR